MYDKSEADGREEGIDIEQKACAREAPDIHGGEIEVSVVHLGGLQDRERQEHAEFETKSCFCR